MRARRVPRASVRNRLPELAPDWRRGASVRRRRLRRTDASASCFPGDWLAKYASRATIDPCPTGGSFRGSSANSARQYSLSAASGGAAYRVANHRRRVGVLIASSSTAVSAKLMLQATHALGRIQIGVVRCAPPPASSRATAEVLDPHTELCTAPIPRRYWAEFRHGPSLGTAIGSVIANVVPTPGVLVA